VWTTLDLALATGRPVQVVAVLEPPPLVAGAYGFVAPIHAVWNDCRDALLARVRNQIYDVVGRDPGWPIAIHRGSTAVKIAAASESFDAALIVMGLGHHNRIDRALGSETALHTLRAARRPLLAVPTVDTPLPRRAVVGIDFSTASVEAAKLAIELVPSLTSLLLVHVTPRWDLQPKAYAKWRSDYDRALAPALDRVIEELEAPAGVTLTTMISDGKPTPALLSAAKESVADMIVVGSQGLGFLDRMLVGSTASGIIRGAEVAVFALPTAALAAHASAPASEDACTIGT